MEFRVLGSLEVIDHDGPVALGAPKQRALLAVLLLHRGEPVSSDRLIDEIWGEQPPASANKIVQGYVSNLRKVLGDDMLVTRGRGYMLRIEPGQTDVDRFEALVTKGRREVLERTGGAPSRVALELTDELGRTLRGEGRGVNRIGLHLNPNLFTWNCLTQWSWDGGTGWGEDHDNWSAAGARRFFADPANRA